MNYRDRFIENLLHTLGFVFLIILWVIMYKKSLILINWAVFAILFLVSWLIPGGPAILFIILKLMHKIVAGWVWIIPVLVFTGMMFISVIHSWRDVYGR